MYVAPDYAFFSVSWLFDALRSKYSPNILLSIRFSNTIYSSFLNVRDKVSSPYKTVDKITVLYILSLPFLDTRHDLSFISTTIIQELYHFIFSDA
jgi:hypothetical protein